MGAVCTNAITGGGGGDVGGANTNIGGGAVGINIVTVDGGDANRITGGVTVGMDMVLALVVVVLM